MAAPEQVMRSLIEAFSAHDELGMRTALADDLTAYVTNGRGGVDPVHGRDAYVQRLLALHAPELEIGVTQSVTVAPDQVLTMVEVRAERGGRRLHNFAAFLATIVDDQVVELWMVEALPAYSDEFWR
ncbi:MAG TPA: nuclear transport factor 2 family protein [Acidimicrobiia bacterium]